MDVIDALSARHSVRAFKPNAVDRETLVRILTAANRAPSWADVQPWEIYVATGEPLERLRREYVERFDKGVPAAPEQPRPTSWPATLQKRMADHSAHRAAALGTDRNDEATRRAISRWNYGFFGAPAMVFLCLEKGLTPWSFFDVGMFAQSLMLAAQEFGVDSIPAISLVAYPDIIRQELGIPENLMVFFGIALGYADPDKPTNKVRSLRRPLEEFAHFKGS